MQLNKNPIEIHKKGEFSYEMDSTKLPDWAGLYFIYSWDLDLIYIGQYGDIRGINIIGTLGEKGELNKYEKFTSIYS